MLANMGTGISIIKITGPEGSNYQRVSGSSIGGGMVTSSLILNRPVGTFWGLSSLLTQTSDFEALRQMISEGVMIVWLFSFQR